MARRGRGHDVGDENLIAQTRDGSGEAFEELWHRHAEAGRRVAARFTRSSEPDDLVQEAYLRIYSALQNGNGPDLAFRPYLYQTIRNIAITWAGRPVEQSITALDDLWDGSDMSATVLENSVTASAFRSLPGRWQSVLWYSEVEGLEPAEIAPLLGIKAGAVSALAYRAREGLRRAWLQVHVNSDSVPPECTWAAQRMGDFHRGAMRGPTKARFEEHVDGCARCMVLVEEINEVSRKLGLVMIPLVAGVPWVAFADVQEAGEGAGALTDPTDGGADRARDVTAGRRTKRSWSGPVAVGSAALALVVMIGAFALSGSWTGADTTVTLSAVSPAAPAPAPSSAEGLSEDPQQVPATVLPGLPADMVDAGGLLTDRSALDDAAEPGGTEAPTDPAGFTDPTQPDLADPVGPADPPAPAAAPAVPVVPADPPILLTPPRTIEPTDPTAPPPDIPTLAGPGSTTPLTVFPTMTGTAQPDMTVLLEDAAGRLLAQVTAGPSGDWSATIGVDGVPTGADDPWSDALTQQGTSDGLAITARAVDTEGRSSATSPPSGTYAFLGAQVLTPAAGAEVTYSATDHDRNGLYDDLDVEIGGLDGQDVLVYIDGATSGTAHRLGTSTLPLYSGDRALGAHTIGIQYVTRGQSAVTAAGPVMTHTFTITAAGTPAALDAAFDVVLDAVLDAVLDGLPDSASEAAPAALTVSAQLASIDALPLAVIESSPSRLQGRRGGRQRTGKAHRPVRPSR